MGLTLTLTLARLLWIGLTERPIYAHIVAYRLDCR
jgi:hypothetical protein